MRLAVDIETTTTKVRKKSGKVTITSHFLDHQIAGIAAYNDEGFSYAGRGITKRLAALLADESVVKLFHNALFDIPFLLQAGYRVNGLVIDTMIQERVIRGGRKWSRGRKGAGIKWSAGLKAVAKKYCGVDLSKELQTSFDDLTVELTSEQLDYMLNDVKFLSAIDQAQRRANPKLVRVFDIEGGTILPLAQMRITGVGINQAAWLVKIEEMERAYEVAFKTLVEKHGEGHWTNDSFCREFFRVKELKRVFDKEFEKFHKLKVGKNTAAKFLRNCRENGRVYPEFGLLKTGRIATKNPSMSSIPKRFYDKYDDKAKKFIAGAFEPYVDIDYKQEEIVISATLAKETSMLVGDYHATTAQALRINRKMAKTVNFQRLYGGGAKALAFAIAKEHGECSEAKAGNMIYHWKFKYNRYDTWFKASQKRFMITKVAFTVCGRPTYLAWSEEKQRYNILSLINHQVQGSGADLLKIVLKRLYAVGIVPLMTLHDSITVRPDTDIDLIKSIMEQESKALGFAIIGEITNETLYKLNRL
jgi:DNA polymerase-1